MLCNSCDGYGNHGYEPETGLEFTCYACGGTGIRKECRYCGNALLKPVFAHSWQHSGYCDAECCLLDALTDKIQDPLVARAWHELTGG